MFTYILCSYLSLQLFFKNIVFRLLAGVSSYIMCNTFLIFCMLLFINTHKLSFTDEICVSIAEITMQRTMVIIFTIIHLTGPKMG